VLAGLITSGVAYRYYLMLRQALGWVARIATRSVSEECAGWQIRRSSRSLMLRVCNLALANGH